MSNRADVSFSYAGSPVNRKCKQMTSTDLNSHKVSDVQILKHFQTM